MKMFTFVNIGERAGGGIPDMVKKWTEAGYGRPALSEHEPRMVEHFPVA